MVEVGFVLVSNLCLRPERDEISRNAPANLPALHRKRSNCQTGTGTDSPRWLVAGEAGCWVGTKKEGCYPLADETCSAIQYWISDFTQTTGRGSKSISESCSRQYGRRSCTWRVLWFAWSVEGRSICSTRWSRVFWGSQVISRICK